MLQCQNMHHYFIPVVRGIFQKGILLTNLLLLRFSSIPEPISNVWATDALTNFATAVKSGAPSTSGRVWWVLRHSQRKDDSAPLDITIAHCYDLDWKHAEVFWSHFPKRNWIDSVKLIMSENDFEYNVFNKMKIIRCKEWPTALTKLENLVFEKIQFEFTPVSAILGVEVMTMKLLTHYLKGKKLKSSGNKLEKMNWVLSSSKPGDDTRRSKPDDDTRQDTGVPGESIVLACDAGVHHEDDLEPEEDDDSIDTRMQ